MSKALSPDDVAAYVIRLKASVVREECWTCDCLQGLLAQIELDCPEAAEMLSSLKVPTGEMHGCMGCDPCLPGEIFSDYIRRQQKSTIKE